MGEMVRMLDSYIRTQALMSALINMILNPLMAWLANRQMAPIALWGSRGIVVDTAVASFVLAVLVVLFTASGVRRDIKGGRLVGMGDFPAPGKCLSRLPMSTWVLGLIFGGLAALFFVAVSLVLAFSFDVVELPFDQFAFIKAVYAGILGYVVARWVVLRHLMEKSSSAA